MILLYMMISQNT